MRFEDSKYSTILDYTKVSFSFGSFYLLDKFIISEMKEGVHFDWNKIQQVITVLLEHYGNTIKIAHISNRINSYSIEPQLWIKFNKDFGFVIASAIVFYSEINYVNATIEKRFSENSIKRCLNLDEAINWVLNLKEFN
ncbi:hypothetical protein [Corallibacter sp.]|uniref:hypothetical protein n=1 Tax=Corallibacter sp. TaxID=2038084 RepID=UPI003AB6AF80